MEMKTENIGLVFWLFCFIIIVTFFFFLYTLLGNVISFKNTMSKSLSHNLCRFSIKELDRCEMLYQRCIYVVSNRRSDRCYKNYILLTVNFSFICWTFRIINIYVSFIIQYNYSCM